MQKLVNHDFYRNEYKGQLSGEEFDKYLISATANLNHFTLGKVLSLDEIPVEVKYCLCELAELENKFDSNDGKGLVAHESIGKQSVTYENRYSKQNFQSATYSVVRKWLINTGLLYRGGIASC